MIPSIRLNRTTIVCARKRDADYWARMDYGAVAVCHISSGRPSRTTSLQFVVTYLTIDTAPEPTWQWGGGDVMVTDLVGAARP